MEYIYWQMAMKNATTTHIHMQFHSLSPNAIIISSIATKAHNTNAWRAPLAVQSQLQSGYNISMRWHM